MRGYREVKKDLWEIKLEWLKKVVYVCVDL